MRELDEVGYIFDVGAPSKKISLNNEKQCKSGYSVLALPWECRGWCRMDETTALGGVDSPVFEDAGPLEQETSFATNAESSGDHTLDQAMEAVDLSQLSEDQVADLESGDFDRLSQALSLAQKNPLLRGEDRGPDRISLKAIQNKEERLMLTKATQLLRDGQAEDLRTALGMVFDFEKGPSHVEGAGLGDMQEAAEFEMLGGESVLALEAKLQELQNRREDRRVNYDFEESDRLLAEIIETKQELREASREAEHEQAHWASYVQMETASRERALSRYSSLLENPENEFNDWLDVEIALADKREDAILSSPDWPEKIADRTFQKYKARTGGGAVDPEFGLFERTPLAPRPGVRMPGSPVGGGANSMALTASAALSEFEKLSPEEQKSVLDRLDKTRL